MEKKTEEHISVNLLKRFKKNCIVKLDLSTLEK